MTGPPQRARGAVLWVLAAVVHLAFDLVSSRVEATTPPYLLLEHAGEVFRAFLASDRTAVLAAVSIGASGVNAAISAVFAIALEDAARRMRVLGWTLAGLWVFSGGLLILVYLAPPWPVAIGSLAAGIPRAFAVAWLLDRMMPRRGPVTATPASDPAQLP